MRIALFTETYLPYVSGVTVSVDALARGLGSRGHQVLVVAPRPARGETPRPVGSAGPAPAYAWLPSYQLPVLVPRGYRLPWPFAAASALRSPGTFAPDVIHAHSPFVTGVLARREARRLRAPLVFTHHTRFTDYAHYLGPMAGPAATLSDRYLRRWWSGCDAVVAPSTDLAAQIRGRMPRGGRRPRVAVIPTGLDVEGLRALAPVDPRPGPGWPPDTVVAVAVGRLAPEKSVELVVEAVAAAAATTDGARLRLLVIGDGPSGLALRERARAPDLDGRVHFAGALPRPEALALAAGGDVLAFASQTETQGLVLAEALAVGLPVVAVDGPGVRDSVRDGVDGMVVSAEPSATRVVRLANTLASLAAQAGLRERLARRARSDAERFDGALRAAEMEELYRSLLAD